MVLYLFQRPQATHSTESHHSSLLQQRLPEAGPNQYCHASPRHPGGCLSRLPRQPSALHRWARVTTRTPGPPSTARPTRSSMPPCISLAVSCRFDPDSVAVKDMPDIIFSSLMRTENMSETLMKLQTNKAAESQILQGIKKLNQEESESKPAEHNRIRVTLEKHLRELHKLVID